MHSVREQTLYFYLNATEVTFWKAQLELLSFCVIFVDSFSRCTLWYEHGESSQRDHDRGESLRVRRRGFLEQPGEQTSQSQHSAQLRGKLRRIPLAHWRPVFQVSAPFNPVFLDSVTRYTESHWRERTFQKVSVHKMKKYRCFQLVAFTLRKEKSFYNKFVVNGILQFSKLWWS